MPKQNSDTKELKLYQYWFREWWGLLILAIAFPWFWWVEIIYFLYIIHKRKEYQLTRKHLIIGGSLLAAFPVFILMFTFTYIVSDLNNTKVRVLIGDGEFQEAREQLKKDPNPDLVKELNKLENQYIEQELGIAAQESNDDKYSEYIVNKTYSEFQTINEQVKSKLISQLDRIDEIKIKQEEQTVIERDMKITLIKDDIELIRNEKVLITNLPSKVKRRIELTPDSDQELKSLKSELIQAAKDYQSKKYPIDRKNYANFLSESLGSDYSVYVSGKNNSRLVIDNDAFFNEENINLFKSIYEPTFIKARYDIIEYTSKEFGTSNEHQLNTPDDTFLEGVTYN